MMRQAIGLIGYVLLFACLLFVPARTVDWPAAWILLATLSVARAMSLVGLWRTQRALLETRTSFPAPQEGQPAADRILLPLIMASFAGLILFTARDVWHVHLFGPPPLWLRVAGLLGFASGWWLVHLALRANAFALTVVRHQRDQLVIDVGPYAVVRHPMYSGLVLVMVGLGLWLGSVGGALAALIPVALLALRIAFEERLLRRELPAYAAYAQRVRARLVPGLW